MTGAELSGEQAGCALGDGSTAQLPGVYFLDAVGAVLERAALASGGARDVLLEARSRASGH